MYYVMIENNLNVFFFLLLKVILPGMADIVLLTTHPLNPSCATL